MFKLHSEYKPTGDQPQAIEYLSNGIKEGKKFQTLLGVTGSGKTFTMANIIQKVQKPTLVLAHNKTLARSVVFGIQRVLPRKQCRIFRFVLWLLPTRKLYSTIRHIYRKRLISKWWNRQTTSLSNSIIIWNKRCNNSGISIMYIWITETQLITKI